MEDEKTKDNPDPDIPLLCQSCEARHGGICAALSSEQLIALSKHSRKTSYPPDSTISDEVQMQDSYANVLSGVVKLSKLMLDGRQQIVGLQFAPDFLGRPFCEENSLIAESATNLRLCAFPKSIIDRMVEDTPALEHRLHKQNLRELDEAREWMLTLGRKTALEKVASFLLLIAKCIDPEKNAEEIPVEMELPLKRNDIADFLGLTIETVSRQMTALRKQEIIDFKNGKITVVIDINKLEAVAQGSP